MTRYAQPRPFKKSRVRSSLLHALLTRLLLTIAGTCLAGMASAAAPDNTSVNERDRNSQALTPLDQPNNKADTQALANIRSALTDDKALSVSAQNVKVIVRNGVATLRGPVTSAEEKARVGAVAQKAEGVRSVSNQLDINH